MSVWIFVIILNLPSFGGEVTATVRANGWEACDRLRRTILRQLGGESNVNGSVTQCSAAVPAEPVREPEP